MTHDSREDGDRPPPREAAEASRPTPVREIMQPEPASVAEGSGPPSVRTVEADGVRWEVQETGATRSGSGSDRGAPLLYLRFDRVEPGAEAEAPPREAGTGARECLAVATSLDDLTDDGLEELLARSRPARSSPPGAG
jgi:hypothetical protein